jgi:hypothetical protein
MTPNNKTNMRLVEIAHCPVCGGAAREASSGMAARKTTGYHYLKHAAAHLGVSVEEFSERAKEYRCSACGTLYCDPWMSPALAASVFCAGAPDHIAGWSSFEHWLSSPNLNGVEKRNLSLFQILTARIGPIDSYGEFGCPFQGFLLLFKGARSAPSARIGLFAQAANRRVDARWTKVTRLYHATERWCGRLVVAYYKLRLVKENARFKTGDNAKLEAQPMSLPGQRWLLTQDTSRGWGSNCVRYGGSCRYFAHTVLDADVAPFDEICKNHVKRFHLIGIFNSLDHTSFPLEVIRHALKLANHVLIVTHRAAQAGRQHLLAFGDDFPQWLGRSLDGVEVADLRADADNLPQDCNYLLLSDSATRSRETF